MDHKTCPNCKTQSFLLQKYEGVEIDICKTCSGVWLDDKELVAIITTYEEEFSQEQINATKSNAKAGIPKEEHSRILHCAVCREALLPNNYSYSSGVIIDFCKNDCGIWLDAEELEKVQIFKEDSAKNAQQIMAKKAPEILERLTKTAERRAGIIEKNVSIFRGLVKGKDLKK